MNFYRDKQPVRTKLNRTFWWLAGQVGEENARAVAEQLTGKASISALSAFELKQVIDELASRSGIDLRKPLPKPRRAGVRPRPNVIMKGASMLELPSRDQLAMIEYHADRMGMTSATLHAMTKKAAGGEILSAQGAQILIEALKSMHRRGWKEERQETVSQTAVSH